MKKQRKTSKHPELNPEWVSADLPFSAKLRPLVVRVGGSTMASALLKNCRQTVNRWLRQDGNPPSEATQTGVILTLQKAALDMADESRAAAK